MRKKACPLCRSHILFSASYEMGCSNSYFAYYLVVYYLCKLGHDDSLKKVWLPSILFWTQWTVIMTQKVRKLHAMNYSAMHSFIFNCNNSNKKLRWRALKVAFVSRWKDCSVYVHKHNKNNIMRGWRKWFSVRNWLHAALVFCAVISACMRSEWLTDLACWTVRISCVTVWIWKETNATVGPERCITRFEITHILSVLGCKPPEMHKHITHWTEYLTLVFNVKHYFLSHNTELWHECKQLQLQPPSCDTHSDYNIYIAGFRSFQVNLHQALTMWQATITSLQFNVCNLYKNAALCCCIIEITSKTGMVFL